MKNLTPRHKEILQDNIDGLQTQIDALRYTVDNQLNPEGYQYDVDLLDFLENWAEKLKQKLNNG